MLVWCVCAGVCAGVCVEVCGGVWRCVEVCVCRCVCAGGVHQDEATALTFCHEGKNGHTLRDHVLPRQRRLGSGTVGSQLIA